MVKPKILLSLKDHPSLNSGYGIIARYFTPLLASRYGKSNVLLYTPVYQRDCIEEWNGITVLPGIDFNYGEEMALEHYHRYKCNILLQLGDIWPLGKFPEVAARNEIMWLEWLMVDYIGNPKNVQGRLKYIYKIIDLLSCKVSVR